MKQQKFIEKMLEEAPALQVPAPPERDGGKSPGDIDLAFGNPAPEIFPLREIQTIAEQCLTRSSLDYCANQGSGLMREAVVSYMSQNRKIALSTDAILITNGATEAISLIAHALLEPHDIVLIETPTYYRASFLLQTFGAHLVPIRMEHDGICIQDLEQTLHTLAKAGKQAKMLYTIPNHHNPMGVVLSQQKRAALIELSDRYGYLIVEDDVYTDLTYDGELPPSLFNMGEGEGILQIGSLSKVLCPGIRTGWLIGEKHLVKQLARLKTDGGTNPMASTIAAHLVQTMDWQERLHVLRQFYTSRRDALVDALMSIPPAIASWYRPTGGFFVWLQFAPGFNFTLLQEQMKLKQIYAMPGSYCVVDQGQQTNALRLAFASQESSILREGIMRLQTAIQHSI